MDVLAKMGSKNRSHESQRRHRDSPNFGEATVELTFILGQLTDWSTPVVQTTVFKYVQEERTDGMKVLQDAVISVFSACSATEGRLWWQ